MKPKYMLLLVLSLAFSASAVGQQRWFENGTGSFKRLQWEDVAIVIFYNTAGTPSPIGGQIFTFANGKFEDWGTVPKESPSLKKLLALINSNKDRWIKMQPHQQGAYLRPNQAVAYADMKTIVSYTKITPIDFGGQEVYAIKFENFNGRGAVLDAGEKARVDKLISDSQNQ